MIIPVNNLGLSEGGILPDRPIGLYELVGTYAGGGADPLNTDTRQIGPILGNDYLNITFKNTSAYNVTYSFKISSDNGTTWQQVYSKTINTQDDQIVNVSLSSFAGQYIKIRFVFDPENNLDNRTGSIYTAVVETNEYTSDGLATTYSTLTSPRVSIESGGYKISDNTVYVDITVKALKALSSGHGLVAYFPGIRSSTGNLTSTSNDLVIYYDTSDNIIRLRVGSGISISSGQIIRFVNSYPLTV